MPAKNAAASSTKRHQVGVSRRAKAQVSRLIGDLTERGVDTSEQAVVSTLILDANLERLIQKLNEGLGGK